MRILLILPPYPGHLDPAMALAAALQAHDHELALLTTADGAAHVRRHHGDLDITVLEIGATSHPPGHIRQMQEAIASLTNLAAVHAWLDDGERHGDLICREGQSVVARWDPDLVLVDQVEPAGQAVAESLGVPFAVICTALPLHRDPWHPPIIVDHAADSALGRLGQRLLTRWLDWRFARPHQHRIKAWRQHWGLEERPAAERAFARSPWLELAQTPAAFDLPRRMPVDRLISTGPCRRSRPATDSATNAALTARRGSRGLVFASLGSLQHHRQELFTTLVEGCALAGCDVILAHGGRLDAAMLAGLPEHVRPVAWADQAQVICQVDAVITHGGINTVLDAIAAAKPLLVIPLCFEQPAVAARVRHHELGEVLRPARADAPAVGAALSRLLTEGHGCASRYIADACRCSGAAEAAAIISRSVRDRMHDAA